MTKLEICAIEDANPGQVNLYPEGSFYKAYQQSAWLLCTRVHPFKVSARPLKGLEGPLLIPGFIRDSYSCIPGRGTHDGILRLEESIRRMSCNYSRPCFVLKLDVEGYFMHIDRERLLEICLGALEPFRERLDFPLVKFLLEVIIRDDPTENCRRHGSPDDWKGLPESKSLFRSPSGCGLPIGNLTSQLFSNIYMDGFDKYMVSLVGEGRYGRYVDDAFPPLLLFIDISRLLSPYPG